MLEEGSVGVVVGSGGRGEVRPVRYLDLGGEDGGVSLEERLSRKAWSSASAGAAPEDAEVDDGVSGIDGVGRSA